MKIIINNDVIEFEREAPQQGVPGAWEQRTASIGVHFRVSLRRGAKERGYERNFAKARGARCPRRVSRSKFIVVRSLGSEVSFTRGAFRLTAEDSLKSFPKSVRFPPAVRGVVQSLQCTFASIDASPLRERTNNADLLGFTANRGSPRDKIDGKINRFELSILLSLAFKRERGRTSGVYLKRINLPRISICGISEHDELAES